MPSRLCPDCPAIHNGPHQRCPTCHTQHEAKRGTTTQRGYGTDHRAERARWQPTIDQGHATCHAPRCLHPTRTISPGADWDLGHNPDRTGWIGPCHPECNRATTQPPTR